VLPELIEDLMLLKGRKDVLYEDGRLDRPPRYPQLILRHDEDVVPEPRLQMPLHLRQIEVRAGPLIQQGSHVVEEVQPEVEDARRDLLAVHEHMLLEEVPTPGTGDDRGQTVEIVV
jgi:hypothetical protein